MHQQNSTQLSLSVNNSFFVSANQCNVFVSVFCVPLCKQGAGTDEHALIEILVTRSNAEIQAMNAAYQAGEPPETEPAPQNADG